MEHLSLGFAGEFSLGPVYKCKICGNSLWTEKKRDKEILKTEDGRRHFKNKCNLALSTEQEKTK